jgi:hypothetical protein
MLLADRMLGKRQRIKHFYSADHYASRACSTFSGNRRRISRASEIT